MLTWAALIAILAFAVLLRLYRLEGFITFYPDTYAQLRAVDNLFAGNFPLSQYPPGVALFLAPVFALFPRTILTLQITIIGVGLALVVVGYLVARVTTNDRRASLLFATAVAFGAPFVLYSRVALFDVINTLLIVVSIALAPLVVRRGFPVLLLYGLLVFTTITVRFTNPVILPALFLASLQINQQGLSWRTITRHLRSRSVVTVGLVVTGLYAAYLGTGYETLTRFTNPKGDSIIDLSPAYLPRLAKYAQASLVGHAGNFSLEDGVAALAVLTLAIVGGCRLWRTNRGMLLPIACLVVAWLPVHAMYMSFWDRYALPPLFFVLMLAALGLSVSLRWLRGLEQPWQRVGMVGVLALATAVFAGRQVALDVAVIQQWPTEVASNRERAYDQLRVVLEGLDGSSSVLVSSQILAVDEANADITGYDLIRHSQLYGINNDSVDELLAYVKQQQAAGATVYYHYTEFEDVASSFRIYELGFDAYFTGIQQEFTTEELVRAVSPWRVQRLYVIGAPEARAGASEPGAGPLTAR